MKIDWQYDLYFFDDNIVGYTTYSIIDTAPFYTIIKNTKRRVVNERFNLREIIDERFNLREVVNERFNLREIIDERFNLREVVNEKSRMRED